MEFIVNLGPCPQCCGGVDPCPPGGVYYIWRGKLKDIPGTPWDRGGVLIEDFNPSNLPLNAVRRWYQPYGTYAALQQRPGYDWTTQVIQYPAGYSFCPSVWNPCYAQTVGNYFSHPNIVVSEAGLIYEVFEIFVIGCPAKLCYCTGVN